MASALQGEIAARTAAGQPPRTVRQIAAALAAIGYRLDRGDDCHGPSQWMTGPRAGISYPCTTTGIVEADTGTGAFNVAARRDARFQALQAMRLSGDWYAVLPRGSLLEI